MANRLCVCVCVLHTCVFQFWALNPGPHKSALPQSTFYPSKSFFYVNSFIEIYFMY